jgi:hypothetical protein
MDKKNKNKETVSLTESERQAKVRKISQMLLAKNKQAYANLAKR